MVNKLLILSESMFHCHSSQLLLATYGFTEKVDGPGKIGTQIFVLMSYMKMDLVFVHGELKEFYLPLLYPFS